MWNLFSTTEPKTLTPPKSLKTQLLQLEAESLLKIEKQSSNLLNLINKNLRQQFSVNNKKPIIKCDKQKQLAQCMRKIDFMIKADINKFIDLSGQRQFQKQNQQQFFAKCLRNYENKKNQLNKYCQQLQEKVQDLELLGLKTYVLQPNFNWVLNGCNQKYINKLMQKITEKNTIKRQKLVIPQKQFALLKQKPVNIDQATFKIFKNEIANIKSKEDLQKLLNQIQLCQQLKSQALDDQIKKQKDIFMKNAYQKKLIQSAFKKIDQIKTKNSQEADILEILNSQEDNKSKCVEYLKGINSQMSINNKLKGSYFIRHSKKRISNERNSSQIRSKSMESSKFYIEQKQKVDKKCSQKQESQKIFLDYHLDQISKPSYYKTSRSSFGHNKNNQQILQNKNQIQIDSKTDKLSFDVNKHQGLSQEFIEGCEYIISSTFLQDQQEQAQL